MSWLEKASLRRRSTMRLARPMEVAMQRTDLLDICFPFYQFRLVFNIRARHFQVRGALDGGILAATVPRVGGGCISKIMPYFDIPEGAWAASSMRYASSDRPGVAACMMNRPVISARGWTGQAGQKRFSQWWVSP